ncbi:MAG: iron-containing alcohol dehydrogenase [Propionibacteriaceae bacterium]|jgi:alcohol dehydrogenase class IV|nr:iron-containing alcohol dehydrogenase [Propionibacteriaceae bacterium]
MIKLFYRVYQLAFRCAAVFLPWRRPERLASFEAIAALLKARKVTTVLIVTDQGLVKAGLHLGLIEALVNADLGYALYDEVVANPTIDNIEAALALYKTTESAAIIALGGGSPMDCAKGVGARLARPGKTIAQMRGQLKVLAKMPLFIAIPTTAGTGSETTLTAVVTDARTHEKYAINDTSLIPHYALLDPVLTVGLPPFLTAWTGMDALCHAVEAYVGGSNTRQTRTDALKATELIFANLFAAYSDGQNLEARRNMQEASFLAGAAFTRAYVGNIHAIAHTLGGQYNTAHGLANAVIMPYILEAYSSKVDRALSEMAAAAGVDGSLIDAIRELNLKMGVPDKIADLIPEDIPLLAGRALREANPLYPVPVIFDRAKMERAYRSLLV